MENNIKPEYGSLTVSTLNVGDIIGDKHLQVKILSVSDEKMQVEVICVNNEYYSRYVDAGNKYILDKINSSSNWETWDFDPSEMKRDASQLLLCWEKGVGWNFDLDS